MRSLAAAVLLLAATAAPAAAAMDEPPPATIPTLTAAAASVEQFAPSGWIVEAKATGDLDGDNRPDVAFVLRGTDPANVLKNDGLGSREIDTNPRILAVALGRPSGYALVAQNTTLIPRHVDPVMDDPFGDHELEIARKAVKVGLSVFLSAGGWDMSRITFAFRLRNDRLELIGYDRTTVTRNTGALRELSVNYLTGRMSRSEGSIENDEVKKVWAKAPRRPASIDAIGDGLDFDPEN